jgi:site-specific recombinase XerD
MQKRATAKRFNNVELSPLKQHIKTVSTTSAQITTVCDNQKRLEAMASSLLTKLGQAFKHCQILGHILDIQISGGCRISEVLQIKPSVITPTGSILIKSAKKGNARIITTSKSSEFLLTCRKLNIAPFFDRDRFWVYREYKKLGILFVSKTSSKMSVTHAPRHIFTASNRITTKDETTLSNALGQKTKSMSNRYGNKEEN